MSPQKTVIAGFFFPSFCMLNNDRNLCFPIYLFIFFLSLSLSLSKGPNRCFQTCSPPPPRARLIRSVQKMTDDRTHARRNKLLGWSRIGIWLSPLSTS